MNEEKLYDIARDAVNDAQLASNEIPPIDLYVDQILNLISERVAQGSERYSTKQLTKTMINNYSKEGLITPVRGKKYNKEQILQMLTIYSLKGTLSIGEIKRLLEGAYSKEGFDGAALAELYDKHLDIKEVNREYALQAMNGIIERNSLDVDNDIDYICLICALTSFSAHLRKIAQAMIDERFPQIPEEAQQDEPKEERKSRKERRRERKAKAEKE